MSRVETLNLLFRFATLGLQFVLVLRMATDLKLYPFKGLFLAFIACSASYVIVSSGVLFQYHPTAVLSLVPLTFPITWLFWTSALALFEDDFSVQPVHWLLLVAIVCLSSAEFYRSVQVMGAPGGVLPLINDLINLSLVLHALFVAWHGREGDLMEARRSFRLMFVGAVGVLIGIIVLTELSFSLLNYDDASNELLLLAAVSIFTIVVLLALQLLSLRPDSLLVELAAPVRVSDRPRIDPADQALYRNLQRAMTQDEVFRTEGLTIGALAQKLGAPEHHLRKLINQAMGYKNFNAYLNQFRIEAAKTQLADLAQARKQVLTIALEAGYASLGPFNRAFKEATGQTPTEFRKQALQQSASASEDSS